MSTPAAARIPSAENAGAYWKGGVAALVFLPVAGFAFYLAAFKAGELIPALITGFMVVAGVAGVGRGVQRLLEYRRFGDLELELLGDGPAPDGTLHARLDLHARDVAHVGASLVALEPVTRKGRRREVERERSTLYFPVRAGVAEIRMRVPRPARDGERVWQLEVHAELPGVDLNRTFPLPAAAAPAPVPAPPPSAEAPALAAPEPAERPVAAPLLILANLVPLAGVLWWDWRVGDVVILYWLENVVIGAYNVLRILAARSPGATLAELPGRLFLAAFFTVHYGMFCFGHGVFLAALFPLREGTGEAAGIDAVVMALLREPAFLAAAGALVLSHGYSFVRNFLGREEGRRVNAATLMSRPYGRIVLLHLFILAGGFLVQALDSPLAPLVLFVLIKTAVDYAMHRRERRLLATPPAAR